MMSSLSAFLFYISQLPLKLCLTYKCMWYGHGHIFGKRFALLIVQRRAHVWYIDTEQMNKYQ